MFYTEFIYYLFLSFTASKDLRKKKQTAIFSFLGVRVIIPCEIKLAVSSSPASTRSRSLCLHPRLARGRLPCIIPPLVKINHSQQAQALRRQRRFSARGSHLTQRDGEETAGAFSSLTLLRALKSLCSPRVGALALGFGAGGLSAVPRLFPGLGAASLPCYQLGSAPLSSSLRPQQPLATSLRRAQGAPCFPWLPASKKAREKRAPSKAACALRVPLTYRGSHAAPSPLRPPKMHSAFIPALLPGLLIE